MGGRQRYIYCEPGNDGDLHGCTPEQKKFMETGVNAGNLNDMGWFMQDLPFKKIRSIVVCGVDYKHQVEFPAYALFNKDDGFFLDIDKYTDENGIVLYYLPTGDSASENQAEFDPNGFSSYLRRHNMFQEWNELFISTCNVHTGASEPLQFKPPLHTKNGDIVGRSFFDNTPIPVKDNTTLIYKSLIASSSDVRKRYSGDGSVDESEKFRMDYLKKNYHDPDLSLKSLNQAFCYDQLSANLSLNCGRVQHKYAAFLGAAFDVVWTNLVKFRDKMEYLNPALRFYDENTITVPVGIMVLVSECITDLNRWDTTDKVDPSDDHAKQIRERILKGTERGVKKKVKDRVLKTFVTTETININILSKRSANTEGGTSGEYRYAGEYKAMGDGAFVKDGYAIFIYTEQLRKTFGKKGGEVVHNYSYYVLAKYEVFKRYMANKTTKGAKFVKSEEEFILASSRMDTSVTAGFGQVQRLKWFNCTDNAKGPEEAENTEAAKKTDKGGKGEKIELIPGKTWRDVSKRVEVTYSSKTEVIVNTQKAGEVTIADWIQFLSNDEKWLVRPADIEWFKSRIDYAKRKTNGWILRKSSGVTDYEGSLKLQNVDSGWALVQGSASLSVKLNKSEILEYSFVDEFYCDRECADENANVNRFVGYCFQSLNGKYDHPQSLSKFTQFLESIVYSLQADKKDVKDGAEILQFRRLDGVQSQILNGWHRMYVCDVNSLRDYIKEWAMKNIGKLNKLGDDIGFCAAELCDPSKGNDIDLKDDHKRIIASALNLNINEFTLKGDFALDKECSAFTLKSVRTIQPLEQMEVPKFWLPEDTRHTRFVPGVKIIIHFKPDPVVEVPQDAANPAAEGGDGGGAGSGEKSSEKGAKDELYDDNHDVNRGSKYAYDDVDDIGFEDFMGLTRSEFTSGSMNNFLGPEMRNESTSGALSREPLPYQWRLSEQTVMKPIDIFILDKSSARVDKELLREMYKSVEPKEDITQVDWRFIERYQNRFYSSLIATGFKVCVESHNWSENPNHFKMITNEVTGGGYLFKNRRYEITRGLIVDSGGIHNFKDGFEGALASIRQVLTEYARNKTNRDYFSSDSQQQWFNEFCVEAPDRLNEKYFNFDGMLHPENVNMGTLRTLIDIYMEAKGKISFLNINPKFVELMENAKKRWPSMCGCRWEEIKSTTLPVHKSENDKHIHTYIVDLTLVASIFNLKIGVVYGYTLNDCNTLIRDRYEIPSIRVWGDKDDDPGLFWVKKDFRSYRDLNTGNPYTRQTDLRLNVDLRKDKMKDLGSILWKPVVRIGRYDIQTQYNEALRAAGLDTPVEKNGVNWDLIQPDQAGDDASKSTNLPVSGVLNSDCPYFQKWVKMGFPPENYPAGTYWGRERRITGHGSRGLRGAETWEQKFSEPERTGRGKRSNANFNARRGINNRSQPVSRGKGVYHRPKTTDKSEFQQFEGGGGSGHGGGRRTQIEHKGNGVFQVTKKVTAKERRDVEAANWERRDRYWSEQLRKGALSVSDEKEYHQFLRNYENWQRRMADEDIKRRQEAEESEEELDSMYMDHQRKFFLGITGPSEIVRGVKKYHLDDSESESDESYYSDGSTDSQEGDSEIVTYAQESIKELYQLTAALGSMAAVVEVLKDNGWSTFKIHVGHTEQSRRIATIIRPFFLHAELYPISKGYTKHMMFAGKGYRKDASERVGLVHLLMSCASLDAYELTKACEIVRDMEIIPKAEFDDFEKKVNRTSGKMYMDWFDHYLAISRVYVQATLEGHVTPAAGYISKGVSDLLNRLVFSHVSDATRRKNQHMLHDLMQTPYGQQIKPFFIFNAPNPMRLQVSFEGEDFLD